MACSNCGKKRRQVLKQTPEKINMEQNENFKLITYRDGGTHTRIITSPTRLIYDYGMQNYGMKKPGSQFYVHIADIEAQPNKFVVVPESQPEKELELQLELSENVQEDSIGQIMEDDLDKILNGNPESTSTFEGLSHLIKEDSTNEFNGLAVLADKEREAIPISEFAKSKDVHHLKILSAYRKGELEGYKDDDGKVFIYVGQEYEVEI